MKKILEMLEVTPVELPAGCKFFSNLSNNKMFYPQNLKLEEYDDKEHLISREDIAGIGHLQALLNNPQQIPKQFEGFINLAPGSLLQKDGKLFIPALAQDLIADAVALKNRRLEWEIILINIYSPVNQQERVIVIK